MGFFIYTYMRKLFIKNDKVFLHNQEYPCIYFLIKKRKIVYVGESTSITKRLASHKSDKDYDKVFFIESEIFKSKKYRLAIEHLFIFSCLPKYNGLYNIEVWGMTEKYKQNAEDALDSKIKALNWKRIFNYFESTIPPTYYSRQQVIRFLNKGLNLNITKELISTKEVDLFHNWRPCPALVIMHNGRVSSVNVNTKKLKNKIF